MNKLKSNIIKYRAYIILIIANLVYMYINPVISIPLFTLVVCIDEDLIYGILLNMSLIEVANVISNGLTISSVIGLIYVITFIRKIINKSRINIFINKYLLKIFIYMIIVIIGILIAINRGYIYSITDIYSVIKENIAMIRTLIICIILFIDFSNKSKEDIRNIIYKISYSTSIILILTFIYNLTHMTTVENYGYSRVIIANLDPNEFSALTASLLIFPIYVVFDETQKKSIRIISIISIVLSIINILITLSRGGLLTTIFLLCTVFLIIKSNQTKLKYIIYILSLIIIIYVINPNIYNNILGRMFSNGTELSGLTTGRSDFWINGIKVTTSNYPLFGYGGSLIAERYANLIGSGKFNVMHNIFVSIFVKYGMTGLLCFIWILHSIILDLIYILKKENRVFSTVIVCLLVTIFGGLSLSWDYHVGLWILIGINFGILTSLKNNKKII